MIYGDLNGEEIKKKEGIYLTSITDSLCCIAETNIIW